ncbi:phosphatase PAP2 family protein [Actinoplanes derwentensis]|uniref:PAP2 superfamily protein n=1 Tax=Actinoplanes derwentensis TaxID=113562 RepID=A0A1H2A8C2_9ACTN|nr:phosphatase PAP2 family protein [Actinoplanes derwentensis]GID88473.1 phosphatidic acid phosphatase [Actinoplanes derwentensis]SDT42022.1 PAP2 superfamily protein [Actinoplanes derwentensis]
MTMVRQRPGAGYLLAPVAVGLLAAIGTVATYHVFVRTISGQWLDTAAMLGTDVQHPRVEDILSRTMDATTLTSLVLVCIVAAAIGVFRKRADLAIGAAVLVLTANATSQILKSWLPRLPFDGTSYPNSLPSGHVTAAASVAFALVLVLPSALRGTAALIGASYTAAIAIGTVWAQWHRPSDVIAALLVVLGCGALAVTGIRLARWRIAGRPERPSRIAGLPLLVTAAITAPVTVLGLLLGKTSESMTTLPEPSRLTFLTGAAGVAAVVAIGFLTWLWLTTDDDPGPVTPGDPD